MSELATTASGLEAEETYDVLILGGGVNGLATAWDCSQRGLRVALVEQGDYGGETSAG